MGAYQANGFLVNDPEYRPFGIGWLAGITPARLAVLLLLTLAPALNTQEIWVGRHGFAPAVLERIGRNWMTYFLAALPMMVLVIKAELWSSRRDTPVRIAALLAAAAIGAVLHTAIEAWLSYLRVGRWLAWPLEPLLAVRFYVAFLSGGFLAAVLLFQRREADAHRRAHDARLAMLATQRTAAEAHLQLLHAQIEPHFLFNSLASVKRLYDKQGGGAAMLASLSGYLRSALGQRDRMMTTLGEEVAMTRGFLDIFRMRMGERLAVHIDVPPAMQRLVLPSLMLGTLVENAVKHGIGPRGAGGRIEIRADREGDQLVIRVIDDGVGFHGETGSGVGLANTRARLHSIHGAAASLTLAGTPGGGVTAVLRLPASEAPAAELAQAAGVQAEARASPIRSGFLQRCRAILSWRHWAWAVSAGVVLAALDRFRSFASPFDMLGPIWLVETGLFVAAATLFMLAIVAVEARAPTREEVSMRGYAAAAATAVLLSTALCYAIPTYGALTPKESDLDRGRRLVAMVQGAQFDQRSAQLFGMAPQLAVHGFLATLVYGWMRRSRRAMQAMAEAQVARARAEHRALDARLQKMQAEFDPAVVFETLDAVREAYQHDRAAAEAMLDGLIGLLRKAIPRLRTADALAAA